MSMLTVRLFGRFGVWSDQQPSAGLGARRAREVLSYLLLHPDRPHRREKLADLLWEDAPPAQARKCLRQALWQVQAALQRALGGSDTLFLEVDPEWIQLHSCNRLQVDVCRFEAAIRHCHGVAGPQLDGPQRQALDDAVQLYRGDLLEGWEQDWCATERERLQNDLLDALDKLVSASLARHDCERGLAYARRMLLADPAREQVHCHIMRLHVLAGNRTEALRAYQCCERLLMRELGVRPSQATLALHESIRAGSGDSAWDDVALLHGALLRSDWCGEPAGPLPELADHLARVQATLARIEARLRQEMEPGIAHEARGGGEADAQRQWRNNQ
jgi:DNA-binding SARP family transcriptional activator